MNNLNSTAELCDRILHGMRVDYTPMNGGSIFSVEGDSWRVEVSEEPEGYTLSFTEDFGLRDAVITTLQFSGLAHLVGLKAVNVFIHEKGRHWSFDSTSALNVSVSPQR
jgi:hypothetical protein